jgi:hypothetical protein
MSRGLTVATRGKPGPQRTDLCAVGVVGAGLIAEMLFDLADVQTTSAILPQLR